MKIIDFEKLIQEFLGLLQQKKIINFGGLSQIEI